MKQPTVPPVVATPSPSDVEPTKTNVGLIVGITIGVILVITILIIGCGAIVGCIILMRMIREREGKERHKDDANYEEVALQAAFNDDGVPQSPPVIVVHKEQHTEII